MVPKYDKIIGQIREDDRVVAIEAFATEMPGSPSVLKLYQFTGTNATLIGGITWYNGDSALYNGSTWTRIPFQSLSNYYTKTELLSLINKLSTTKNPALVTAQTNGYYNATGVLSAHGGFTATRYDVLDVTVQLYYSGALYGGQTSVACYFNSSNVFIGRQHAGSGSSDIIISRELLVIPANTAWIGFCSHNPTAIVIEQDVPYNNQYLAESLKLVESKWTEKKWMSLGDSVTNYGQYQSIVKAALGLSEVNNKGIGGTLLGYYYTISGTPITPAVLNSYDIISFCSFINNYRQSTVLGTINDTPAIEGSFYAQLKYLIEYLCTHAPTKVVVGISNLQFADNTNGRAIYAANAAGLTAWDYNTAMRLACERYGLPFIDMINRSGVNSLNFLNFYTPATDTIHPNNTIGMQRMAAIITREFQRLL